MTILPYEQSDSSFAPLVGVVKFNVALPGHTVHLANGPPAPLSRLSLNVPN